MGRLIKTEGKHEAEGEDLGVRRLAHILHCPLPRHLTTDRYLDEGERRPSISLPEPPAPDKGQREERHSRDGEEERLEGREREEEDILSSGRRVEGPA